AVFVSTPTGDLRKHSCLGLQRKHGGKGDCMRRDENEDVDLEDVLPDQELVIAAVRKALNRCGLAQQSIPGYDVLDLAHEVQVELLRGYRDGSVADPRRAVWKRAEFVVKDRQRYASYRRHESLDDHAGPDAGSAADEALGTDHDLLRHL